MSQAVKKIPRPPRALPTTGSWWPLVAAIGVLGYLGFFLSLPTESSAGVARGQIFLVSLLRPDDVLSAWFDGASWNSFVEHLTLLTWTVAVLSVAAAAGWLALRLVRADRLVTRLEMVVLAVGVGFSIVSLATLALGLAGLLRRDLFAALGMLTCVAAATTRRVAGCESGTCQLNPQLVNPQLTDQQEPVWNWSARWLWLLVPFTLAIVGSAMTPPLDFDVREYHLQAPKEFYQAGCITFLPHNVYANMPLGTEMLALAGMVASGDWWTGAMVGKTLIALFAPLGALLLYAAGCRLLTPAAGIVAALVYTSIPWVAIVSTHALVEGAFAFYLFASLYVVILWQQSIRVTDSSATQSRAALGLLGIAGFLAGSAVSTKYPAVLYCALPLTIFVAAIGLRSLTPRALFASFAVFLLAMLLACGLWFAKNAVFTGNPTYPLLYSVFGADAWSVGQEQRWQNAHRPPPYELGDLAERLWHLALVGTWISPLVVPLALLSFFQKQSLGLVRLLTIAIAFIFVSWWLLTHRIDRFLVPIWPLVALLAGIGATWNASTLWRRSIVAFLLVGLTYDFMLIAAGPVADNRYLMSLTALRAESVHRIDPWHAYLNEHAGEIQAVLLVGDAQPFDLEVPVQYNTVFDRSIFEALVRDHAPEEVRKALLQRGISHIYVSWPEIERYRSPGNYGITEFLQPRIFAELVDAGVLERLPQLAEHGGELYRVIAR